MLQAKTLSSLRLPARSRHPHLRRIRVRGHRGRLTREQRSQLLERVGSSRGVQRHLAAMARYGVLELYDGNDAQLLVDGPATFDAMFHAIEHARQTILIESYMVEDVALAQRLAELLLRKRAQGVQAALLYDAVGSFGTSESYFERLREAGIAVCAFNPTNPLAGRRRWAPLHRDHRKILVVDREIAFTGGVNISGVYSRGSFVHRRKSAEAQQAGWRDTQVQLRGPAAAALDDLVRETWAHQGCADELPLPAAPLLRGPAGDDLMRIVPAHPDDAVNGIEQMLLTAIDAAEHSVQLTMAYFAPGPVLVQALCDAAGRGVEVQLILPSRSDFRPVLHAGRSYYEQLLRAGARIHEFQDAVLHAKTAVIDGVVSTVGSCNLDRRSLRGNNEVNAVVIGAHFGAAMQRMFATDIAASRPVELAAWRQRPWLQRALEGAARRLENWW